MKNLNQDNQSLGQEPNVTPTKNRAGVLTTTL
jgi:hypothetical protein